MASSSWWKLRALIKKNLIVKRRNFLSTIFEIFFPILMFGLIIGLRKCFLISIYNFEEYYKNNMIYFMENGSILSSVGYDTGLDFKIPDKLKDLFYNLSSYKFENLDDIISSTDIIKDIAASLYNKDTNISLKYLGIPIKIPPLYICSKSNEQKQERPYIASIGIPELIKARMIIESKIYNEFAKLVKDKGVDFDFALNTNSFKEFESIQKMEEYIKDPDYINHPERSICFGMKFSHDEQTNYYNYSLHFFDFDKIGKEGIQDIPNNAGGMFDKFQSGPDLYSFMRYKNGAYNYMMKLVNEYILKQETNNLFATFSYGVFPMKAAEVRMDIFGQYFGYVITIIIIVAYMSPLSIYIYKIVEEKEAKTKEGMKIMGLGEGIYFLSYFIQFTFISIFVSGINAFLLNLVFKNIPYYYLYLMIFLFSLNIFS